MTMTMTVAMGVMMRMGVIVGVGRYHPQMLYYNIPEVYWSRLKGRSGHLANDRKPGKEADNRQNHRPQHIERGQPHLATLVQQPCIQRER
jgi:hypothetical protein